MSPHSIPQSLHPAYRSLRSGVKLAWSFVRSPKRFFGEVPASTNPLVGLLLVAGFAFALAASVLYLGGLLAATVDLTVTVDNPGRPSEAICETVGDDSVHGDACDEPAEVERDAGEMLREMTTEYVGMAFVVPFVLWALSGTILLVAARAAGGTGGVGSTFEVAAWAVVPEFVRLIGGLVALRYALGRAEFTGPVETLPNQFLAAVAPVETPLLVVSLFVLA